MLNISVRQLYRQFELDGDSIGRYIQRQRLHCAARDLAQTGDNALPITTIAYKWGFTDSAHFPGYSSATTACRPRITAQTSKAQPARTITKDTLEYCHHRHRGHGLFVRFTSGN